MTSIQAYFVVHYYKSILNTGLFLKKIRMLNIQTQFKIKRVKYCQSYYMIVQKETQLTLWTESAFSPMST